ncbi:MAG TPA: amidohydrolase family protein [Acidimicrobiales bacterium]|nr:amidohydrolase family protein [Acidimicrobiales bacterium]
MTGPVTGPNRLLVAGGRVGGLPCDLRLDGGRIVEVAPGLARRPGEPVLDAAGRPVLPGLHDHHLHLRALAAAAGSVTAGPPAITDRAALAEALRGAAARLSGGAAARLSGGGGWVRAVGYHESVAGHLDRDALDRMLPGVPVRVQHRSGSLWVVNSAGADRLGLAAVRLPGVERDAADRPTGRLYRMDRWLGEQLGPAPVDLAATSARLASLGVTGVTDATPAATAPGIAALVDDVDAGRLVQRLHLMCPPDVVGWGHPLVTRGPCKVLLDDRSLPSPDELAGTVADCHRAGVPVAVHCVTAVQLVVAVAAFDAARSTAPSPPGGGPPVAGDRIEHASVVPPALLPAIRRLGLTVVTNPSFVAERGDAYLSEVDPVDRPDLYRCRSLLHAGVPVAAGTDAPFADPDPQQAVDAAVTRRTRSGRLLGPAEAVDRPVALALFGGHPGSPATPRRLRPGEPADLCIPDPADPADPDGPWRAMAATVVAGRVVHRLDGVLLEGT